MLANVSTPTPTSTQGGLQQLQPSALESQTFITFNGTKHCQDIPRVYILIVVSYVPWKVGFDTIDYS